MADAPNDPPATVAEATTYTPEFVESLKQQLAAKTEAEAMIRAKYSAYESRQRDALKGLQPTVESWISEGMEGVGDELRLEMEPMLAFGKSLADANVESALPLARLISVHSAKFKRTRDEFSASKAAVEDLGAANKKTDELAAEVVAKNQRITELEALANERQLLAEKLQNQLANAGLLTQKYDFSLPSSREVAPPADLAPAAKTAVAAPRAPIVDPLEAFVQNGTGGGRVNSSGTSHHLLGASVGGNDTVDSLLRAI